MLSEWITEKLSHTRRHWCQGGGVVRATNQTPFRIQLRRDTSPRGSSLAGIANFEIAEEHDREEREGPRSGELDREFRLRERRDRRIGAAEERCDFAKVTQRTAEEHEHWHAPRTRSHDQHAHRHTTFSVVRQTVTSPACLCTLASPTRLQSGRENRRPNGRTRTETERERNSLCAHARAPAANPL